MSQSARYASKKVDVTSLAEPLRFEFSGRSAPNRFLKAAMSERLASWDDKDFEKRGIPSKELINLYRRWREADIGLVLSGNVMIELDQLEAPGNPVIPRSAAFSGERFEAFKAMGAAGKTSNNLIVAQVSHPGRQVSEKVQAHPISASDVQLAGNVMGMTFAKPRAATQSDIDQIIEGFAHAAVYLEKAGWDGIQLHGAHGYLLSQFLSPTTNLRTDKYGGSLENRAHIIFEIAKEIRARTSPTFIVGIKLNSVEFQDKGFQTEEARELCAMLEQNNFDFIELSGGTYESLGFKHSRDSTVKREAFFIEFAELIAPAISKTKVYITGGFKTVGGMVAARQGVDGVGMGRAFAQEPRLAKDILSGKVNAALKPAFGPDDFQTSFAAAALQLKQVGRDQEPLDVSVKQNLDVLNAALGGWMKSMGEGKHAEVIDLLSSQPLAYGPQVV